MRKGISEQCGYEDEGEEGDGAEDYAGACSDGDGVVSLGAVSGRGLEYIGEESARAQEDAAAETSDGACFPKLYITFCAKGMKDDER
jgi:hypothetical protein